MESTIPVADRAVRFARRVFLVAGVYGLLALVPLYFLEEALARAFPPPLTHPDHFYGFLGVTLAWQIAFLVIARDPARFRPLMAVAVVEKFLPALSVAALVAGGRTPSAALGPSAIDFVLGIFFLIAFRRLRPAAE